MTLSGGVKSPPSSLPPSSEPSSTPVNEPAKEAEFQSFLALQELAQEVVHEAETRRAVEVARIEALREAMKDYTPRQYQLHLLELAKETNIIAVVKTGGGKVRGEGRGGQRDLGEEECVWETALVNSLYSFHHFSFFFCFL